ncbi:NusB antitermination factor [Alkalispirochaeta americana]|uniref:Transcription antitermination protein NusB n=1 Tax=Alkalispirochaeta americana TaxID=159291 RepID=A0A1N6P3Y5_9SPIO|nr:transcription antitermination factor NusB [Alkalispirochaeta americana]SIP98997.1 NusB antitermination factor [Alkalispirochaeta americana]
MASRRKSRRLVVQALYSWDTGVSDLPVLLQFSWSDPSREDDLAFPRMILQGTLENLAPVDQAISEHLTNWDIDRLAKVDLAILRMSTYCLMYQPDLPAQITIDEAVELAKELSTDEAYRFINGVLDGIRRDLQSKG